MSPIEKWHLQEFQSFRYPSPFRPLLAFTSSLGSHVSIELYNVIEINQYTSNLYRAAVFVLMSHLKTPADTSRYLEKYHLAEKLCFRNGSLEELVYASYVVTIYSIIGGQSVLMALRYCYRFCRFVVELTKKRGCTDDWTELLWRDALVSLYYVHRDTILSGKDSTGFVEEWRKLLDTSYSLLVGEDDIANLPLSMTTEKICHKVTSLAVYFHLYLDQFLARINADEHAKTAVARDRLYSISDRIVRLVTHVRNISDYLYHAYDMKRSSTPINDPPANMFLNYIQVEPRGLKTSSEPLSRDTALAILYAFARLIKNLLQLTTTPNENEKVDLEISRSAVAICRLCANIPIQWRMETFLVKRSLFWAGLVLTETKHLSGQMPFLPSFNCFRASLDQKSTTQLHSQRTSLAYICDH